MKITKQLNNNIVIASDSQGREIILMGKGIGFGCKPGMEPDMRLVEKQYFGLSSGIRSSSWPSCWTVSRWSISPLECRSWSMYRKKYESR